MTTMKSSVSLDSWREYFRRRDSDIFGIIDHAIMVAAADYPKKFRSRRDKIAELLFSCRVNRCTGCDHLELSITEDDEPSRGRTGLQDDEIRDDYLGSRPVVDGEEDYERFGDGGSKESKVNSSRGDNSDNNIDETNLNSNQIVSNYTYGEAEALSDEMEQASVIVAEVKRIKSILLNKDEESSSVLLESLRLLKLMSLNVDILKATEIGKAVNGLRKHGSDSIRQLAKTLIAEWKELVDQWVNTTKEIAGAEGTPESANPSVLDEEEAFPSLPYDVDIFTTPEPNGFEISQFFDSLDVDGNLRNSGEYKSSRGHERTPQNFTRRRPNGSTEANVVARDNKSQRMRTQEAPVRPVKPSSATEQKMKNQMVSAQKSEKPIIQRKPIVSEQRRKIPGPQQEKLEGLDADAKFEFAKRKLQESYQNHEKAKKQRTIQVLEEIPKQGNAQKSQLKRPGMNRNWANGRK